VKPSPLIIPIFIPHEGCPHRCVYCDQTSISGVSSRPNWTPLSIRRQVEGFLDRSRRRPAQVAFYGGSFTMLSETRQRMFLESVQDLIRKGRVQSLRLSTRPDAIEPGNLSLLRARQVKTIELGVQSLSNKVLAASARGHNGRQVREAACCVREFGFQLGLQLMPGLPGDDRNQFLRTVDRAITLRPDFVRIYPTVVLAGAPLERLYRLGHYRPLAVSEAVDWCKEAELRFGRAGIAIIRMGLQTTASLEQPGRIVAGPYHPAFGQLVKSAIWYDRISKALEEASRCSRHLVIHAPQHELADIRGHRNGNLKNWVARLDLKSLSTAGCARTAAGNFRITSG
jgi:histone acetyltransferase (RNA polymerase elongator complex component)